MRRITAAGLAFVACAPKKGERPRMPLAAPGVPGSAGEGGAVPGGPPPAEVVALLAEVSAERLAAAVHRLAAFGTRHTLSDTKSETRGIGAARRWLKAELEAVAAASGRAGAAAMRVSLERHAVAPDGRRIPRQVELVNVVAELPGAMPEARARRYCVVAHYDSRARDPLDAESDAPGANDDASGVAVALELARVMATRRFDATVVFLLTAGEEQGLVGARLHARAARERGDDVRAVLSNDIVGDPSSPSGGARRELVRVFSEGLPGDIDGERAASIRRLAAESDSRSRQIARYVVEVAAWHGTDVRPLLVFRADRFLRGGDHLAFNELGYPAVRLSVVDESYARQHEDVRVEGRVEYGDRPEYVDAAYLAGVARVNGAALAHLASAPSEPRDVRVVTADLAPGTTLRWSRSPEPDTAGYEIVWRETTSPVWQHALDVGAAAEATLDMNKDNFFFGVRAYDPRGYRSPVAFADAAKE